MFIDLVGSTALSAQLDPEDMRELVGAYHRCCADLIFTRCGDPAKAEAHFERAIAIARSQEAKSWELRAAATLARLLRIQGKQQQATDLLAPIYDWFTEGFDTLDPQRSEDAAR
jgi:class 3 adenylate cyclase